MWRKIGNKNPTRRTIDSLISDPRVTKHITEFMELIITGPLVAKWYTEAPNARKMAELEYDSGGERKVLYQVGCIPCRHIIANTRGVMGVTGSFYIPRYTFALPFDSLLDTLLISEQSWGIPYIR